MSFGRSRRPFSVSRRVLPVSTSSCLLFFASSSYKRHFLRLPWLLYRSSCVRLEVGNLRRPPLGSAFCRLSCATVCNSRPRICSDIQCSVGFSVRFIGFFVMQLLRSNISPWQEDEASLKNNFRWGINFYLLLHVSEATSNNVMKCSFHWQSKQKWGISNESRWMPIVDDATLLSIF